jgi:hypothetical protein
MTPSQIKISKNSLVGLCFIILISALNSFSGFAQTATVKPTIKSIIPRNISSDMFVMVNGEGLYSGKDHTYVIFSQGGKTIRTYSTGGGFQANGVWGENVQIPQGLKPGICKVEVEVDNQRSQPFFVFVKQKAEPPKLSSVSQEIVNPGYFIWIRGSGFIENQILEMTDAEGQSFTKTVTGVSTENDLDFTVPITAYSGIAKFRVIENRNGTSQASNEIEFEIRKGAIPLLFNKIFFVPLAQGQWLNLNLNDPRPLFKATKIELKLTQERKSLTTFISNFRRLDFQVPKSFHKGKMQIQTRTWIEKEVSEWSKPLKLNISEKPAIPTFHSMETIPLKAEAMFKQNGEVISILPIYFGVPLRVNFPEQIKKGNLEIYTRYLNEDNFTDWKNVFKSNDFDIERSSYNDYPQYGKEKFYTFNPFFERFYFENNLSKFFIAERGTKLIIYGNFYVKSINELKILLENSDQKAYLTASDYEFSTGMIVNIPKEIPGGDWRLWLINTKTGTKVRLPVKIRFN